MSVVYKISFDNESYIGSCKNLHERKMRHKTDCLNENGKHHHLKLYQFIRENYKWEDVIFVIVEQHDTILDKLELMKREQHFIDELKPTLNCKRAFRSDEVKKQIKKQEDANYRAKHNDKIKKFKNKKAMCECGNEYTWSNRARHLKSKAHIKQN